MRKELSVLLPVYECSCTQLVNALHEQCAKAGIDFEIVVADDGSPCRDFIEDNRAIERLDHVRYVVRPNNVGRAAIRNFLAREARYAWLLFCDGDMELHNPTFIATYLQTEGPLVYGGYTTDQHPSEETPPNLRHRYEQAHRLNHSAEVRSQHPYHDFHTSNFLVERQIMAAHPFDERFRHYGYEDVLWGKQLEQKAIPIVHIDNPLSFCHYEDNAHFIDKTEEGLRTLATFRSELDGFSPLLAHFRTLSRVRADVFLAFLYKMTGKKLRNSLIHNNPPLFLFNIYKLLYFAHCIKKTDK